MYYVFIVCIIVYDMKFKLYVCTILNNFNK